VKNNNKNLKYIFLFWALQKCMQMPWGRDSVYGENKNTEKNKANIQYKK